MHSNVENMIVVPNHERKEIIVRINVYLIPCMDFDNEEIGGKKKLFLLNQSINIVYLNKENVVTVPNHKQNRDYYKNSSLSHFMHEFCLYGKLWKEKPFLQN